MATINEFFQILSSFLWGWPMIVLLLGTHIFLTIRLRVPQRKLLTGIRLSVQKDKGEVSQFGALTTALAATIGTGNIVGVATAVALGGPGAVLWCWLTGVFGMATKYAEGLLAVKYRVRDENGRTYGGPMYALEYGLGMKWLAVLFASFTALASFGIGCTVQANSIAYGAGQQYRLVGKRDLRHLHLARRGAHLSAYGLSHLGWRESHRPRLLHLRAFHGVALCHWLHRHPLHERPLRMARHPAHCAFGL